ncbi:MAG TPA: hypothetical protein VKF40_02665 [Burkholderiales bacterium]|nr:hypothetical protein [Burkholderiales bacterium]
MATLELNMLSPCVDYLDSVADSNALAARPAALAGKVVGLIPNWRPAAVHILTEVGRQLQARHQVKEVVLEPPVHVSAMAQGGKLLDGIREQLHALARRVDVAITATGD